jgi:transposase InsO family protein
MHLRQKLGTSERRARREPGADPVGQAVEALWLSQAIELLAVEGWRVNHKKAGRLWRAEGLQLPARHKQRVALPSHNASVIPLRHYKHIRRRY